MWSDIMEVGNGCCLFKFDDSPLEDHQLSVTGATLLRIFQNLTINQLYSWSDTNNLHTGTFLYIQCHKSLCSRYLSLLLWKRIFESQLFGIVMVFAQIGELDISLTIWVRPLKLQRCKSHTHEITDSYHPVVLDISQIRALWFFRYNPSTARSPDARLRPLWQSGCD